jgi:predicted acyltransferase
MEIQRSERLLSLDVFRGLTIAGMILVNNPGSWGSIYPSLKHAPWHGVTPTDLIFPFFLFIVGIAITFSLSKRKTRGDNKGKLILQIVRRSVILFALGLFLHSIKFDDGVPYLTLEGIRIPGVLQRIGVVYFFSALLFLFTDIKIITYISFALLLIYWGLMTLIPVPGIGYANLEPATNLAAWLDYKLLAGHLWVYTKTWDPEGILSTIPAVSSALFGIIAGHWLRSNTSDLNKVVWMFVIGNFALLISMFWDIWFPINKNIWTSSYVLYTTGLALIILAISYFLIDIKKSTWWTKPLVVYGVNAITVYFLSTLMAIFIVRGIFITSETGEKVALKTYIFNNYFLSWLDPLNASLLYALTYVLFWLGIMWILYVKRIFIKI